VAPSAGWRICEIPDCAYSPKTHECSGWRFLRLWWLDLNMTLSSIISQDKRRYRNSGGYFHDDDDCRPTAQVLFHLTDFWVRDSDRFALSSPDVKDRAP